MAIIDIFRKIGALRAQQKKLEMEGAKKVGVVKSLAIGAGALGGVAVGLRAVPLAIKSLSRLGAGQTASTSTVAGVAGKKSMGTILRGAYERALGNPFGGGVKSFFGRIAGRAVGAPLFAVGAGFAKSAVTGKPVDLSQDALVKGSIGFALGGPVGYLVGTGLGAGEVGFEKGKEIVQNIPMPTLPSAGEFGRDTGEVLREFALAQKEFAQGFGSGIIGAPSVSYGVAGPSVNVDVGGRSGIPPELWLLLVSLLGVAGARAYLKRRKKRKSKKRKK